MSATSSQQGIVDITAPTVQNVYLGFDGERGALFVKADFKDDLSGLKRNIGGVAIPRDNGKGFWSGGFKLNEDLGLYEWYYDINEYAPPQK